MSSSRYVMQEALPRERARMFVALDNLTAQVPLIEVSKKHFRIWTAYDYARECGTYTALYPSGRVVTVTVYPGGREVKKLNRPADRKHP